MSSPFRALLDDRALPLQGAFLSLTRRCPLQCRHCSTRSGPSVDDPGHEALLRAFVASMEASVAPPRHLLFTGGEPFLHPALIAELAARAHRWGGLAHAITGGFFATAPDLPVPIARALAALDSLAISWDRYHAEHVSLAQLARLVRVVLERGTEAVLQVTTAPGDEGFLDEVRGALPDVPVFHVPLGAEGRAADHALTPYVAPPADVPCDVASWPVVTPGGTVVACCNQRVVDADPGDVPPHLSLGRLGSDTWDAVRARRLDSTVLDVVETFGPGRVAGGCSAGRCETCRALRADADPGSPPSPALRTLVRGLRRRAFAGRMA